MYILLKKQQHIPVNRVYKYITKYQTRFFNQAIRCRVQNVVQRRKKIIKELLLLCKLVNPLDHSSGRFYSLQSEVLRDVHCRVFLLFVLGRSPTCFSVSKRSSRVKVNNILFFLS